MEFKEFKKSIQKRFADMSKDADSLFEVELDKDALWNLYLDSFPAGTNEIYRQRREFDCSYCRQFIKNIGNAVFIKNNVVHTIWGVDMAGTIYEPVAKALNDFVKSHAVSNIYVTKSKNIGTDKNYETVDSSKVLTWEHFYLELPQKFVDRSGRSAGDIQGDYRATKQVFKRSLDEITMEAIDTVLELIAQNSLYRGEEWKGALTEFKRLKKEYEALPDSQKDNYTWVQAGKVGGSIGRIRNHSIGTLLVNISEDMDLDEAVKKYEVIVAPANYKRPKAIFTKRMLEDAKKTIAELGYMESLPRRYATLDDITVNNILFSNKDAAKRISGADIFGEMEKGLGINPKKFSSVQEVTAEDFVKNILPTATEVEVLLENKHAGNMVSLIAPQNADAPTMFKWGNGFSWAYSGNMADSALKENVKMAGGRVDGVLRFSIQWNDVQADRNDLDAHCQISGGHHIFFADKVDRHTGGNLDVDIRWPRDGVPAVENITWPAMNRMKVGDYKFYVHNYAHNGGRSGFRAEIEFDGVTYAYNYDKEVRQGQQIEVATVHFDGQKFTIKEKLPSSASSREVWGLTTNQFVPVSVVCYSPNYWDEQDGIGNKHYFFMLKDCVNPESPNGFYNEYLKQELVQHKRVFEALGGKMAVADTHDQLSGLGFSSTKRGELVVKVKGATERVVKIKF